MKNRQALFLIGLLIMVGQTTNDYSQMTQSLLAVVVAVIPVFVVLMVLRLLFNSFREIGKTNLVKVKGWLQQLAILFAVVGQTDASNPWSTDSDIWGSIIGIVMITLPFLVLIIVLRSIFRSFTKDW